MHTSKNKETHAHEVVHRSTVCTSKILGSTYYPSLSNWLNKPGTFTLWQTVQLSGIARRPL